MAKAGLGTRIGLSVGLALLLGGGGFGFWMNSSIAPVAAGKPKMIRWTDQIRLERALRQLESEGIIRNATASNLWARIKRIDPLVRSGTYELTPGQTLDQILAQLRRPIRQMVRIPEGLWIAQIGPRLEKAKVCTAEEYFEATKSAHEFQKDVSFDLPKEGSLEGYLFPDTYDLPPLLGAKETIRRMLKNFEAKVVSKLPKDADIHSLVIKASMIEREAKLDSERALVAGVIENRLAKGMTLDMDATVLYGIQDWRVLGPGEVRNLPSPYNTYLNKGLPPGPIGSPSWKSIEAALNPAKHNYLFYVAKPDGSHTFTTNYDDHRAAIRTNRRMFK